MPAKPLGGFVAAWEAFVARRLAYPRIAVLGAGVAGLELAFAMRHRLKAAGSAPQITVLCREGEVAPGVSDATRRTLVRTAEAQGIAIRPGPAAAAAEPGAFLLQDGSRVAAEFLVTVAGTRPQAWLAETGLRAGRGLSSAVGPTLQTADPAIFAVGDCAHLSHAPRPKAGVFAVREAPVLFANLRALATGKGRLKRYQPQTDYLKLISLGDKRALADRTGMTAGGGWIWAWKDRIDRKFMAKFADLKMPPMRLPRPAEAVAGLEALIEGRPLCGGCGAKLGPGGLAALAEALPPPRRPDVLAGAGDDAAQLATGPGGPVQVIATDHLRKLCLDEGAMAEIAATHALGDIWAMGAEPQAALAQIVLPQMGEALQRRTLARDHGRRRAGLRRGWGRRGRRAFDPRGGTDHRLYRHRARPRPGADQGRRRARRRPDPDQAASAPARSSPPRWPARRRPA